MIAAPAGSDAPLHVLLAEDSDDDARLITRALERAFGPTDALAVADLETFRVALEYGAWHLVISDHSNPKCRPEDLLEILDEDQLRVPFLLVSGHVDAAFDRAMRAAGARACVGKHEMDRLVEIVAREVGREAVSRRRSGRLRAARRRDPLVVAALESLPVAALLLDPAERVRHANAAAVRLLGVTRRECRHRPLRDWCTPQGGPDATVERWGPGLLRRPFRMPVPIELRTERVGTDAGPELQRVVLLRPVGSRRAEAAPSPGPLYRALIRQLAGGAEAVATWARLRREVAGGTGPSLPALELMEASALVVERLLDQWRSLLRRTGGGPAPERP